MSGVPPVDRAALPADIRAAAPARREAYTAALGFEQALATQLAKAMVPEGTGGAYAQLLPDALADSLTAAGGMGLARLLTDATVPEEPSR